MFLLVLYMFLNIKPLCVCFFFWSQVCVVLTELCTWWGSNLSQGLLQTQILCDPLILQDQQRITHANDRRRYQHIVNYNMNTTYWYMNKVQTYRAHTQLGRNYVAPASNTTDAFFPDRTT